MADWTFANLIETILKFTDLKREKENVWQFLNLVEGRKMPGSSFYFWKEESKCKQTASLVIAFVTFTLYL